MKPIDDVGSAGEPAIAGYLAQDLRGRRPDEREQVQVAAVGADAVSPGQ